MTVPVDEVDYAHTDHAIERRKEKARALGRNLWLNGYTHTAATGLSDDDWKGVAAAAGVHQPSSETAQMALRWLDWLWRKDGPPPAPEPEPAPERPAAPVRSAGEGGCAWQGCDGQGRLYPSGRWCDGHSPWARKGQAPPWEIKRLADEALAAKLAGLSSSQV